MESLCHSLMHIVCCIKIHSQIIEILSGTQKVFRSALAPCLFYIFLWSQIAALFHGLDVIGLSLPSGPAYLKLPSLSL